MFFFFSYSLCLLLMKAVPAFVVVLSPESVTAPVLVVIVILV